MSKSAITPFLWGYFRFTPTRRTISWERNCVLKSYPHPFRKRWCERSLKPLSHHPVSGERVFNSYKHSALNAGREPPPIARRGLRLLPVATPRWVAIPKQLIVMVRWADYNGLTSVSLGWVSAEAVVTLARDGCDCVHLCLTECEWGVITELSEPILNHLETCEADGETIHSQAPVGIPTLWQSLIRNSHCVPFRTLLLFHVLVDVLTISCERNCVLNLYTMSSEKRWRESFWRNTHAIQKANKKGEEVFRPPLRFRFSLETPRAFARCRFTALKCHAQDFQTAKPLDDWGVHIEIFRPSLILSLAHCLACFFHRELIGASSECPIHIPVLWKLGCLCYCSQRVCSHA
jgi:hypothetical protein